MKNISKKSVKRAVELLKSYKKQTAQTQKAESQRAEDHALHRLQSHCIVALGSKSKHSKVTSFSKNLVLAEIKSQLARRKWKQLRSLLLTLLHRATDVEPLIWRYFFLLALYSSKDNLTRVNQFFNMCIGSQQSDTAALLHRFLTLPPKN